MANFKRRTLPQNYIIKLTFPRGDVITDIDLKDNPIESHGFIQSFIKDCIYNLDFDMIAKIEKKRYNNEGICKNPHQYCNYRVQTIPFVVSCMNFEVCRFSPQFKDPILSPNAIDEIKKEIRDRIFDGNEPANVAINLIVDEYTNYLLSENDEFTKIVSSLPPQSENIEALQPGQLSLSSPADDVQKQPENKQEWLLEDDTGNGAFLKGRINMLYSHEGVGKTLLAITLTQSPYIKNPLYISLDDSSDEFIKK